MTYDDVFAAGFSRHGLGMRYAQGMSVAPPDKIVMGVTSCASQKCTA